MDFNLVNLSITVRTDDATQLCHCLPLLGNKFAAACRSHCCLYPARGCCSCSSQESCAWNLVFGQRLSADPSAIRRFQKPPLPFMFSFPSRHDLADRATEVECGLVVIGQAIPCLDMLLEGFSEILLPLAAEVLQIGTRDYQGSVLPLRDGSGINCSENLTVLSSSDLLGNLVWTESCLQIKLTSPLRIIKDGRILANFDFSRFSRSLLRRVSSLAYYYGGCEFTCDYKELSRQAEAIICTEEHFTLATDNSRRVAGLMGYGTFQGNFSGLLPFLAAGPYVHVGKGASFGMGAYELLKCRA